MIEAYLGKGGALTLLQYPLEALNMFEIALKMSPNDPILWYYKSSALTSLGKLVEARQAYGIAEQLSYAQQPKN
jgi:Flp pilus assembly protein TadD